MTKGHVGHGSTRIIKRNCDSIFRDILKQQINKRIRKKENRRKSNERKRKRTENNVRRVYQGISVGNPLGNDPPQCLVYPPSLAVPEENIKVEDIFTSLFYFIDDGPYIAQVSEVNSFTNAARTRITINFKQEVRDYVYTFMYLEEYTLTEIIAASILAALVKETPTAAQAAKKNSTAAKMNMIASESCI